ncbi:hypothetical protein JK359_16075 [Streptomyces actinomycinicus]|uniref:HTH luxR-type domain-containing protein n=1 Tax=Streptomyces actinomycinicus TaxID=1695166 RepID=A0A937JNL1_9ACTN|nr:LuxR family transcriptional regulator [Streptomyces actinomycinicus]MBL1083471.1 hypothetical protein [Streptomyces actinomycinicus]
MASAVPAVPSPPSHPTTSTADLLHLIDTPALVGRDRERSAASNILTAPSGPGGVMLVGPAGIGKSRLGREIAAAALPSNGSTAGRDQIADIPSTSAAPPGSGPVTAVDHLTPDMVEPTAQRLLRTPPRRPRLLWIDDAHLLSPPAIETLRLLLSRRTAKVLMAVNADEAHPHLHVLWKDQYLARLDLGPLDVLACRRLAGALLTGRLTSSSVVRLARMSAGNPLLLRELVRAALTRHLFVATGSRWHLPDVVPTSATLRDLVARSLQPIGAEARHTLELIALAEPARLDVLEKLVGLPALVDLEDHGLIHSPDPHPHPHPDPHPDPHPNPDPHSHPARPGPTLPDDPAGHADHSGDGSRTAPEQRYVVIAHPYLGHVLRQDAARSRSKHHLRTWKAILPEAAAQPAAQQVRLAQWHLDAGDVPSYDDLISATRHALNSHDLPAASRLARAAWHTYRTAETAELKARTLLACAAFGELDAFATDVTADRLEDSTVLDSVRARAFALAGRYREAEAMTGRLPAPDAALVGAVSAYFRGHFPEALNACAPLRSHASRAHRIEAGLLTVVIQCHQGRPLDALETYRQVSADAGQRPSMRPLIEDSREEIHAIALLFAGRLEEAENQLARVYHHASHSHALRLDAQRGLALGWALYERGRPRKALTYVTFTPGYQVGWEPWQVRARLSTALAHSCLRHTAGTESDPHVLTDTRTGHLAAVTQIVRARAAHRAGDHVTATRALHEAVDDAMSHRGYADAVVALHETARLGLAAHPAVHVDHPVQGPFLTARLHYARALATGDEALLSRVARTLAEVGAHMYAAEAYAELARLHRQAGRERAATAATAEARTLLEHCDDVLTPPLGLLGEAAPLSARERTIAHLAAQGLTDKEIAGRLVVSPRTVSNTLYRVYQKTGANDRRHLRKLLPA